MSAMDKSPGKKVTIMRVLGDTSLGAASTAEVLIGGGPMRVPSGCDVLLGIWTHLNPTTNTNDEAINAWGYLDSEDGFNIKPFEFFFPNVGCNGATTNISNSTPGLFWPINCPVTPGGRINAYGALFEACTAAPYASITFLFGKNLTLPSNMDDYPGRHRWAKIGQAEGHAKVADDWGPAAQYQFSLSARGGVLTEIAGLLWTTTQDPTLCSGGAHIEFSSADVPLMPCVMDVNAFGAVLNTTPAHDGSDGVTRRPISLYGERVVHIDTQAQLQDGNDFTTGYFSTRVEFVREGE